MGVMETEAQGGIEPIPTEPIYEIPGEVINENRNRWNGYSDGRLDPHLDDAYNVYCIEDQLNIWGGKPDPRLITSFPLVDILSLTPFVGTLSQDGVFLQRLGEGYISVQGSNGNTPPLYGTKGFALGDCIAANGGIPEGYEPPPPPAPPNNPPSNPLDDETARILDCLKYASTPLEMDICNGTALTSMQQLWDWISILCWGGLGVGLAAYVPGVRLRRKRRHSKQTENDS